MTALVVRGDARRLPLPDASVDLIVTSPPYFALRSYTDGCPTCADTARAGNRGYMERYCPECGRVFTSGRNKCHKCDRTTLRTDATKTPPQDCPDCGGTGQGHYEGQIGSEPTPAEYLDALWACTREWMRVLKPEGSLWVNLGDKYAGKGNLKTSHNNNGALGKQGADGGLQKIARYATGVSGFSGVPDKSLIGIPWRYALGCIDQLGLILRAELIWAKPNGLPESVTDRVRRSHEQWFHFVKQPRYYAAVDEIREAAVRTDRRATAAAYRVGVTPRLNGHTGLSDQANHPLGSLPGSVWSIPSEPLTVPAGLGVDHFAAFPTEWPRRLILGWSPPGGRVVDPFGGTGTTALVAHALGRVGVTVDMSADYSRLAHWRTTDRGELAKAMRVPKPAPVPDGQLTFEVTG